MVTGRRQDGVLCDIVCAAAAEHEGVHAHSHMASLRLDALPNKHACAFQAVYRTRLWADLVAVSSLQGPHGAGGGRHQQQDGTHHRDPQHPCSHQQYL